jgi:hypothetical protein
MKVKPEWASTCTSLFREPLNVVSVSTVPCSVEPQLRMTGTRPGALGAGPGYRGAEGCASFPRTRRRHSQILCCPCWFWSGCSLGGPPYTVRRLFRYRYPVVLFVSVVPTPRYCSDGAQDCTISLRKPILTFDVDHSRVGSASVCHASNFAVAAIRLNSCQTPDTRYMAAAPDPNSPSATDKIQNLLQLVDL